MSEEKKSIILNLPKSVYDAVCEQAKRNGLSVSAFIRALIAYGYKYDLEYDHVIQQLTLDFANPIS